MRDAKPDESPTTVSTATTWKRDAALRRAARRAAGCSPPFTCSPRPPPTVALRSSVRWRRQIIRPAVVTWPGGVNRELAVLSCRSSQWVWRIGSADRCRLVLLWRSAIGGCPCCRLAPTSDRTGMGGRALALVGAMLICLHCSRRDVRRNRRRLRRAPRAPLSQAGRCDTGVGGARPVILVAALITLLATARGDSSYRRCDRSGGLGGQRSPPFRWPRSSPYRQSLPRLSRGRRA